MELSSGLKKDFWDYYNTIDQHALHDIKQRGETNRWRFLPNVNLLSGAKSVLSRWVAEKDVGIFLTLEPPGGRMTDALRQQLFEKIEPYMSTLIEELDAKKELSPKNRLFRGKFMLGKALKINPVDPVHRGEAAEWIQKETQRYTSALRRQFSE